MFLRLTPLALVAAAAAGGALVTLLVTLLPFVSFAYRSVSAHVAIETAAALIALLTAYLVFGRFRESRQVRDLALVFSLALFAGTNMFLSVVPALASPGHPGTFATWAPVTARLLGASVFAFAAFAPDRRLPRRATSAVVPLALTTATLALIAAVVAAFAGDLPSGIDPELSPEASARPRLVGHPAVLAVQLAAMGLFAAAAGGFARRAQRTSDDLTAWLAAASVLAAFARLNYFLFPSLYSEWVYTGDVLRLAFYVVLLTGAAREIRRYWRRAAQTATLEERRRVARDLHDGLAQELAFIVTEARRVRRGTDTSLESLATAAERALDESRRAIAALTRPMREPLDVALTNEVEHVADRVGVTVKLDVAAGIEVSPAIREELLRIAREAVTNAGKHGEARTIAVSLANGDGVHLRVVDDGRGFDPTRVKSGAGSGFGLVSMQERASALGAEFAVRSRPGEGTEVEVVLP